jgi:hypothetical protein
MAPSAVASGPALSPISRFHNIVPRAENAAITDFDDMAITVPSGNTAGDEPAASRRMTSLMKKIEPSAPAAIFPRNSAAASKVHISTPALRDDCAAVLDAAGIASAVAVAVGVGEGAVHAGQLSTQSSIPTPTPTNWLLIPELLARMQAHPADPVVKFPPFTPDTGAISTLLLLEVQKVADAVVRSANLVLFFLVKVPITLN